MFHVTFDSFDQIWNQVMAPCELHVNLGERITNAIAFIDEAVVNPDRPENYRGNNAEEDQE